MLRLRVEWKLRSLECLQLSRAATPAQRGWLRLRLRLRLQLRLRLDAAASQSLLLLVNVSIPAKNNGFRVYVCVCVCVSLRARVCVCGFECVQLLGKLLLMSDKCAQATALRSTCAHIPLPSLSISSRPLARLSNPSPLLCLAQQHLCWAKRVLYQRWHCAAHWMGHLVNDSLIFQCPPAAAPIDNGKIVKKSAHRNKLHAATAQWNKWH